MDAKGAFEVLLEVDLAPYQVREQRARDRSNCRRRDQAVHLVGEAQVARERLVGNLEHALVERARNLGDAHQFSAHLAPQLRAVLGHVHEHPRARLDEDFVAGPGEA